jgi:hypothetical protein
MLYTSPWSRFELTTSVVIGTDCIGSCKFNYHAITTTPLDTQPLPPQKTPTKNKITENWNDEQYIYSWDW